MPLAVVATGVVPQLGSAVNGVLIVFPPNGAPPKLGLLKLAVAPPRLSLALNPPVPVVVGAGLTACA